MCKLWNCLPDKPCHWCRRKDKKPKPIPKESKKRAKQNRQYEKLRKKILKERPICECGRVENGILCNKPATTIHHPQGRMGDLLTDEDNMIPMAMPCHEWVELHPLEAKKLNLSKDRIK